MNKRVWLIGLVVGLAFSFVSSRAVATEKVSKISDFKIGVIGEKYQDVEGTVLFLLKKKGYTCEPLLSKMLLDEKKISAYHYIVVSDRLIFTQDEYKGMENYVRKGGFLVLIGRAAKFFDINKNGKFDRDIDKYAGKDSVIVKLSGCRGNGTSRGERIKINFPNSLTKGFPIDTWINAKIPCERLVNIDGIEMASIEYMYKGKKVLYSFIIGKETGDGLCISFAPRTWKDGLKNETSQKVLYNIFSLETYNSMISSKLV